MRFWELLSRAVRLRCPVCGTGRLFRGLFAMYERCPDCQLVFEREQGFFLGAIYFNYGVTSILALVAYPVLRILQLGPEKTPLLATMAIVLLFPIWFFRYSRSLWLGFDQLIDPRGSPQTQNQR